MIQINLAGLKFKKKTQKSVYYTASKLYNVLLEISCDEYNDFSDAKEVKWLPNMILLI